MSLEDYREKEANEMNEKNMPGFTAEASLPKMSARYTTTGPRGAMSGHAEVFPQQTASISVPEWILRALRVCTLPVPLLEREPNCFRQCVSTCLDDDPGLDRDACESICYLGDRRYGVCPWVSREVCLRWEWRLYRRLQWAE